MIGERRKKDIFVRETLDNSFMVLVHFFLLEPSHAMMSAPKCWVHSQTPHIVHISRIGCNRNKA